MRICIVAASREEIQPFVERHKLEESNSKILYNHEVEVLITGVGITSMVYYLLHHVLFRRAHYYILAGIGGALNPDLSIGDVVEVESDLLGDLGAQDKDGNFISLEEMGLMTEPGMKWETDNPIQSGLERFRGITVHQVLGMEERIKQVKSKYDADVCSMEGAAFLYVMTKKEIPSMQVRSISNYVEDRNREHWDLPLAIRKLNDYLQELLENSTIELSS